MRTLAGGAVVALAGRFAGRLFSILGDIIAARVLGPAIFGLYSIGWTVFRVGELLVPLGLDMGILRYGSLSLRRNPKAFPTILGDSLRGTFFFATAVSLALFFLSPWLAFDLFSKPDLLIILRLFALGLPFAGFLSVLAATTRLTERMVFTAVIQDFGQPLLALALLVVLFLVGARAVGAVISDILSYAVAAGCGFYFVGRLFPGVLVESIRGGTSHTKGLFAYSLWTSLTNVVTTLVFWVDRLLIGYFLLASASGVYQAVSQLSVAFIVVQTALNRILTPQLVNLHHEDRHADMEDVYRVGTKWGLYISVPLLIVLFLSPGDILAVTYGQQYVSGAILILVLLLGQTVNLATGPVGPLLASTGHQKLTFYVSGLSLLLSLVLNITLIPKLGLLGAAIGTSVSLSLAYVVLLIAAKRRLNLWPYDVRYWKGIIAAIGATLLAVLVKYLPVPSTLLSVLLQFSVAGVGFSATLLLMRLDREDLELIHFVRHTLGFDGSKHG